MSTLCIHCRILPQNPRLVSYKDTRTGKVYTGHTGFCSIKCENLYQARLANLYPTEAGRYVEVGA
jgi:hypothetical protein